MYTIIKNIHLLVPVLKEGLISKMEYAGHEHRRNANITFKIVEVTDKKIVFQVVQGKSAQNNYQTAKRLVEIVSETFGRFFPDRKIIANAVPYKEPDCNHVTHEWIVDKMKETGTRLKKIADDTGIDYPNLSTIVNGGSISQPMKAMFWYYFLAKGKA